MAVCLFLITVSVFGQTIDRSKYTAIDPFDYKLDEEKAARGAVRTFKSVVQFVSQNGTVFTFSSLDQGTMLDLRLSRHLPPPSTSQRVTVYYTATKGIIDTLALDEIDFNNTTEEGIGLKKSAVQSSSGIRKSDFREIDPFDYKIDAENSQRGDVRRYKSTVLFSSQNGISYTFVSTDGGTMLSLKVGQRLAPMKPDQKVTIYYTATKGIVDSLILNDIEF